MGERKEERETAKRSFKFVKKRLEWVRKKERAIF